MLDGEDFYTNNSPRISRKEITEVENALDIQLQRDHTHGAQAGPIAVYPLHEDDFTEKAKKFLIQSSTPQRDRGRDRDK